MRSVFGYLTIGLLAVTATTFIACSGGADESSSASTAPAAMRGSVSTSVGVTLTEWDFVVDKSSAKAGEVSFKVMNDGIVPHDFVVIRSNSEPTELPQKSGSVDESGINVIGRTGQIERDKSEKVSFTLEAGRYVLICNIPAHYDLGMLAAFTVE